MLELTLIQLQAVIVVIWLVVRIDSIRRNGWNWKMELRLLLALMIILILTRFTFFPEALVDGRIQPLVLDVNHILPFNLNLVPLIPLLETYGSWKRMILGNIVLYVPMGFMWPWIFKKLNRYWKAVAACAQFSLIMELFQLPFAAKRTDINDLILNVLGASIGCTLYFILAMLIKNGRRRGAVMWILSLMFVTAGMMHSVGLIRETWTKDPDPEALYASYALEAESLLPEAGTKAYPEEYFDDWDATRLELGINEIYARNGLIFQVDWLREYFTQRSWYQGTTPYSEFSVGIFNEYEWANINLMSSLQGIRHTAYYRTRE